MTAWKKVFLFLGSQLRQIKAGGHRILFRKLKKAARLLGMSLAAPLVVYFKMDWPKGNDFLINQALKKFKRLRSQPKADPMLMNQLLEQSIYYLKQDTDKNPDFSQFPEWMRRSLSLGNSYILKNDIAYLDIYQRAAEVWQELAKRHQWDDLAMEFIPRFLPLGSIGVYEYLEVYIKARMLDRRRDKKMILLLPQNTSVNNPGYLKYWSKYFTIISDPAFIEMLAPLENLLLSPCVSFIPFRGKIYKSALIQGIVREQWREEARPPFFTISQEDYERGWHCLRSLGLPKEAWFVTLHVREPGWRDGCSWQEHFRNADIRTYFPAIKAITEAGGWVVRIGDPGMTKLPVMPHVIDYAHSQAKSDWMDIFLCAQCRFMMGTSSGMCTIASAFGVPLVMTNLLPGYGVYHFTSQDLCIPRMCFSKDKERYLSFRELISPPVGTATAQSHFDHQNVQIIENKPEEIKAVVEEMLDRYRGTLKYSEEDETLQKEFQKIAENCGKVYGDLGLAAHVRIGKEFLNTHAELLSHFTTVPTTKILR